MRRRMLRTSSMIHFNFLGYRRKCEARTCRKSFLFATSRSVNTLIHHVEGEWREVHEIDDFSCPHNAPKNSFHRHY
jgi:hypothetical protein